MKFPIFAIDTRADLLKTALKHFALDQSLNLSSSIHLDASERHSLLREGVVVIELDALAVSDSRLQIQLALQCETGTADCVTFLHWIGETYTKDMSHCITIAKGAPIHFHVADSILRTRQARHSVKVHDIKAQAMRNKLAITERSVSMCAWRVCSRHPHASFFRQGIEKHARITARLKSVSKIQQGLTPWVDTQAAQSQKQELSPMPSDQTIGVSPSRRPRGGPKPETIEKKTKLVQGWLDVQDRKSQEMYCAEVGITPSTLRRWMEELGID